MIKRMMLLSAAVVLSLAFATPGRADTMYTATGSFTITGGTASDVEISVLSSPSPATLTYVSLTGNLPGGSAVVPIVNNLIVIDFSPASSGNFAITFSSNETLGLGSYYLSDLTNGVTAQSLNVSLTTSSVPEPSSIALLGIGLSGFIAFRRRFSRKLPVA
jgi:hypothetical protein